MLPITYLLPIRSSEPPSAELSDYLRELTTLCRVLVVDGSAAPVFDAAHERWAPHVRHLRPGPDLACGNGKVHGVLTGLREVTTEYVVIADDDVRHTDASLQQLVAALQDADAVMPQNWFQPLPWHARWDTARTLINRVSGGDFAGTIALRITALEPHLRYDGDVLFENLELLRTVEAAGGRVVRAAGIYVRRLPPTTHHFLGQRVRQAYDELARPVRFVLWLAVLPALLLAGNRRRLTAAGALVLVAEAGRRRDGGRRHFPWTADLLAPLWVLERSITVWIALVWRVRGGVPYSGQRLRCAAHSMRMLRRRAAQAGSFGSTSGASCRGRSAAAPGDSGSASAGAASSSAARCSS